MTTALATEIINVDPFGDRLHPGPGAAFVVLVAFLVSFLAIRTSARMTRSVSWWPGRDRDRRRAHPPPRARHHADDAVRVPRVRRAVEAPWWHLIAIGFGVGAGFTLDEFALWVRLEDVYWSDEGRSSFDAVVCSCAFAALVVIGTRPFGLDDPTSVWGTAGAVTVVARPRPASASPRGGSCSA